jgi:signal transduction histidine kinase
MTAPRRLAGVVGRVRHPQTTVRWRLTLLYGGLFLISGVALLAITYTLVDNAAVFPQGPRFSFIDGRASIKVGQAARHAGAAQPGPLPTQATPPALSRKTRLAAAPGQATIVGFPRRLPPAIQRLLGTTEGQRALGEVVFTQRVADLHQLVIESAIALALMAILSTALGWVVAGRVLRPLRTMTTTTQEISEENLNRRLAMSGPPDELRQLADTIDGLLGRLEGAFDAQRRFVANASHELRTPLTAVRALLEMVLSDPHATVGTFRATCEQVLEESEQEEQLIDALLTLAQGQRGIDHAETFDLAAVVREVMDSREGVATASGLTVSHSLEPAMMSGDARLVARLASNLVDNAIGHNVPGGRVSVRVQPGDTATLTVMNTGPTVPPEAVERLLQPFQRMTGDRTGSRDGLGLGLSIVAAIASAHDAALSVRARPEGGLDVDVRFPLRAVPPRQARSPVPLSVADGTSVGIGL